MKDFIIGFAMGVVVSAGAARSIVESVERIADDVAHIRRSVAPDPRPTPRKPTARELETINALPRERREAPCRSFGGKLDDGVCR